MIFLSSSNLLNYSIINNVSSWSLIDKSFLSFTIIAILSKKMIRLYKYKTNLISPSMTSILPLIRPNPKRSECSKRSRRRPTWSYSLWSCRGPTWSRNCHKLRRNSCIYEASSLAFWSLWNSSNLSIYIDLWNQMLRGFVRCCLSFFNIRNNKR